MASDGWGANSLSPAVVCSFFERECKLFRRDSYISMLNGLWRTGIA